MEISTFNPSPAIWIVGTAGAVLAVYAVLVIAGLWSYGRSGARSADDEADPLLDRFLPWYEVRERHQIEIAAPVSVAFQAACAAGLFDSGLIRAIFRAREWIVGADTSGRKQVHKGLVEEAKAMGWGVLLEIPGREIVMGAVTQPWAKNVVFHALPPELFADFREPGFVKIVWTLRVDPAGAGKSVHRTETRASATNADARAKFRRYWAFFSPGIVLIRRIAIRRVKAEAERAARSYEATRSVDLLKDRAAHRH